MPYRRNMTICMDSNQSNWIYIVKTGQCRILKGIELKAKCGNSTSGKGGRPETRVQYYYCKSNNIRSKRSKSTTIQNSRKQSNSKDNKIFIELKTLEPNSVFGLESIVFEPFGGTTSVSLVSDGAECVAISKKFFIEHCPTNFMNWLRSKVQPFPKVEELESKLSIYREWKLYRNRLLEESTHQLRDS